MSILSEDKFIRESIESLRLILVESVSSNQIKDAISNHKIIYIYYDGDENESAGYRTIEPWVLGVTTSGNEAVRAWEQAGASATFKTRKYRPFGGSKYAPARSNHEYFYENGRVKPGWRLFLLSKIKIFYPTGKTFKVTTESVHPLYNENDKGFKTIYLALSPESPEKIKTSGLESPNVGDGVIQKLPPNQKEPGIVYPQNLSQNELNKDSVNQLVDIANKRLKRKLSDLIVVYKNNDIVMDYEKNRNKYKPDDIIGNLSDLKKKFSPVDTTQKAIDFFKKSKNEFNNQ